MVKPRGEREESYAKPSEGGTAAGMASMAGDAVHRVQAGKSLDRAAC